MIIKVKDSLVTKTNFLDTLSVPGSTLGGVLTRLLNTYPQLTVFLTANGMEEAKKTALCLNGEYLSDEKELARPVKSDDVLELSQQIPDGEGGGIKMFIGLVLIAAALIPGMQGLWAALPAVLASMGAGLIVSGLSEIMLGSPQVPSPDGSDSPTYTFSGIRNTTAPGTPLSIVYGVHRVGGHLLNVYTDIQGIDNYLRAQIGLCEGEIEGIDALSILVNQRSINYFPDVDMCWRKGTSTQYPPPAPLKPPATDVNKVPMYGMSFPRLGYILDIPELTPITSLDIEFSFTVPFWYIDRYNAHTGMGGGGYYKFEEGRITLSVEYYPTATATTPKTLSTSWVTRGLGKSLHKFEFVDDQQFPVEVHGPVKVICWNTNGTLNWISYTRVNAFVNPVDPRASMYGFNRVENAVTYDLEITKDGTVFATSAEVDTVILNVYALAFYNTSGGNIAEATVEFDIWYRINGSDSTPWTQYKNQNTTSGHFIFKGKSKSEVSLSGIEISLPEFAVYDIKLVRVTDVHTALTIQDEIRVKEVNEVVHDSLIYPHTALLGVRMKATEQLSGGMPNITALVRGTKIAVPTGYNPVTKVQETDWHGELTWDEDTQTGTKFWCDNPVWCLYDLLTNKRYGLGNYFKIDSRKKGLMIANFYQMAQYCDEYIMPDGTVVGFDPNATDGRMARFTLNMVLDSSRTVTEWISAISATFRGAVFYTNGIVYLDIDRPKSITQTFNMTEIRDYTQTGLSYRSAPNVYEVQYPNALKDYELDVFLVESPERQLNQSLEEYRKTLDLRGIPDERRCRRLARYALLYGVINKTLVSFKTGTLGLRCMVGDVIGVQHDVPQWGLGGRIKAVNGLTLTLDSPVTLGSNLYHIRIQNRTGDMSVFDWSICEGSGTFSEVTFSSAPPVIVHPDASFSIGTENKEYKPFKVLSIKRSSDELVELSCIEYNENLYALADDISAPADYVPVYSFAEAPNKVSVSQVKAEERVYINAAGVLTTGVDVFYKIPDDQSFWKGVVLHYGIAGDYARTAINDTGHIFIPEVSRSGDYSFVLPSLYKDGTSETLNEALYNGLDKPYSLDVPVTAYVANTQFTVGVQGLQLDGKPNSTQFEGRDAIFVWRRVVSADVGTDTPAGDEQYGAGTAASDSWLKEYTIEIRDLSGVLRRRDKTFSERYVYTHEMNGQDGITRAFTFTVSAVDRIGRTSNPVSLTVWNAAPALLTDITCTTGTGYYSINIPPSTATDLAGYVVHASTTSGFIPSESTLVAEGTDLNYTINLTRSGNVYVRVAAYDTFGKDILNYSDEMTVQAPQWVEASDLELELMKLSFQSISWTQFAVYDCFADESKRQVPEPGANPAVLFRNSILAAESTPNTPFTFTSLLYADMNIIDRNTSGTGALNIFTDNSKQWSPDELRGLTLRDSLGASFAILSNTATALTVSGTPSSGAYTIKEQLPAYMIGFCDYSCRTNGDGAGDVKFEVSLNAGGNWITIIDTANSIDNSQGTIAIPVTGKDWLVRMTLTTDNLGRSPVVRNFLVATDPSPWRY